MANSRETLVYVIIIECWHLFLSFHTHPVCTLDLKCFSSRQGIAGSSLIFYSACQAPPSVGLSHLFAFNVVDIVGFASDISPFASYDSCLFCTSIPLSLFSFELVNF